MKPLVLALSVWFLVPDPTGPVLVAELTQVPAAGSPELLDRTLALVGGQPITLSDARAALALGLVPGEPVANPLSSVALALVDRELILREVQRYAPPAPAEAAVDARLEAIRKRFPDGAALTRVLDAHGFTDTRLRAWVRDDLRTQAYLAQRFASASTPTEQELSNVYARSRAEFDKAGQTFEQATPILREQLIATRRRELIADWISDLRRRTDVIILQ